MVEEVNLNFRHLVRQGLKCQVEVALQSRVSKSIRIRERVPNAMKNLSNISVDKMNQVGLTLPSFRANLRSHIGRNHVNEDM